MDCFYLYFFYSYTCVLWLWERLYNILATDLTLIEHFSFDPHNIISK